MKIGILTFQRALNYGAFLQAYATMSFLRNNGYNAEMVDYWPREHADYVNKRKLTARGLINKTKQFIIYLLSTPLFKERTRKMNLLRQHYLGLSKKPLYIKGEELSKTNYDVVVYGSDQIWWNHAIYSPKIAYDKTYWGYYLPDKTKRVAYAPSMGIIDIQEHDKAFIKDALTKFSSLSTRETSLRDALQPYTYKDITVVLDPVFLPDKEFWLKQIPARKIKEPYLLYYSLIPTHEAHSHAEALAKSKGLRLVEITANVRDFRTSPDLIQTADALEFVSLIRHADYVVSTSFHGTAFSIILEKQFCVVGLGKRSDRVVSLLKQLGIDERYTNVPSTLENIDYESVNKRLYWMQEASRNYITESIE